MSEEKPMTVKERMAALERASSGGNSGEKLLRVEQNAHGDVCQLLWIGGASNTYCYCCVLLLIRILRYV